MMVFRQYSIDFDQYKTLLLECYELVHTSLEIEKIPNNTLRTTTTKI